MKFFKLILLSSILIVSSCSKDIDIFTPDDPFQVQISKDSLALLHFENLAKPDVLSWSWDVTEEQTIETPGLAKLYFPPNAFVYADQSQVSGRIEIQVSPALATGAMVLSDISCLADDNALLEMIGIVEVQVVKGNQILKLAEGKSITITLPINNAIAEVNVYQTEAGTWQDASQNFSDFDFAISNDQVFDTDQDEWLPAYRFQAPFLGRIGLGFPFEAIQGQSDICFELPSPLEFPVAKVFAVSTALNTVVPLQWNESQYCTSNLPVGENFEFVFIGVFEEQYYYDRISMDLLDTPQTAIFNPSIYSVEDIIVLLKSF